MVDYGLKDKVVLITGTNNPQGIGVVISGTKINLDLLSQFTGLT